MSEGPIRVLIADDHALVREGIRRVLEEDEGIAIVGEAADGTAVLAMHREHDPDVLVLDISMPGASGIEITERLRRQSPSARVLILSMHDETEYVLRAVRAGARGYLLKDDAGPSQLREAIRTVHQGDSFFSAAVAGRLAAALQAEREPDAPRELDRLTARELEVLRLVAAGGSNKAIAVQLGISRRTVESHRESLMRKLEIRTVAGLTRFALAEGLLDDSPPP